MTITNTCPSNFVGVSPAWKIQCLSVKIIIWNIQNISNQLGYCLKILWDTKQTVMVLSNWLYYSGPNVGGNNQSDFDIIKFYGKNDKIR